MSLVFSQDNELLIKAWEERNPGKEQYLNREQVANWAKQVLKLTKTLQNFEQSLTDLPGLIRQYVNQVHEVDSQSVSNIQLSYPEAVDFLKWLTNSQENLHGSPEKVQKQQNQEHISSQKAENNNSELHKSVALTLKNINNSFNDCEDVQSEKNETPAKEEKNKPAHLQKIETNSRLPNSRFQTKTQENKKMDEYLQQKGQQAIQVEEAQEGNGTSVPQDLTPQQRARKYKDYLKIIFQHYCKISYATGQDPTFQQIQHKTSIMTINKFMVFCKDFDITKVSSAFTRVFLMEIFKKNSLCYKEMGFQHFIQAIKKLGMIAFDESGSQKKQDKQGDIVFLSHQFVLMAEHLEISTFSKFKQKMKKLNIQYRIGGKKNTELKKLPVDYKFKFISNNGKSQQQMKQQINERKVHRSERKLLLREKLTNNQEKSVNHKKKAIMTEVRREDLKIQLQGRQSEGVVQSVEVLKKALIPPVPLKKLLPPHPPKQNSSNSQVSGNIFKKQVGYSDIHKLKNGESYSKRNSQVKKQGKSSFKLNSIVQQARMEVEQNRLQSQGRSQNLTESIETASREETGHAKGYNISRINNKMQLINQKLKKQRQAKEELNNLLNMDIDEEDEFLREHLQREKKNEFIGKRISNRITELEKK